MPFGAASGHYVAGVELLNETQGPPDYCLQSNSEYRDDYPGSETVGDNIHGRKGNNPAHLLRSLISAKCIRMSNF